MAWSLCEGRASFHVRFKKLVSEMLGEESEHETGALWVGDKLSPHKKLLGQSLSIGQLLFT